MFRGPIRSQPRRLYYDLFDLAPYLQPGENVLAVYVKYYGTPKSYWMPAVPNMTLGKTGILVLEANLGEAGWLVSDSTWKARKADAWSEDWRGSRSEAEVSGVPGVPIEVFDARRFPHSWREAPFDDRGWGLAQVVPAMHIGGFAHTSRRQTHTARYTPARSPNWTARCAHPLRVRVETLQGQVDPTIGSPVKRVEAVVELPVSHSTEGAALPAIFEVSEGDMARLTLDMGRIVSGLVGFEIDAPAGMVLDLSYAEEPVKGPSTWLSQRAGTRYIARGENDIFQVFDSNGFRYAHVLAHGVHGPVTFKSFWVREQLYPWQEGASFTCNDEELNRIYTAGFAPWQLNSHDAFIDCPTREQRAWVGDGMVHQMVSLATNLDWRLAWHYLTLETRLVQMDPSDERCR